MNSQEITELQNVNTPPPKKSLPNEQYRILNYFKDHTGFFVAFISAIVAIISFVIRFAISRLNFAYLEYWDVATLHANVDNQNEFYLVVCTLLYSLALILIHVLLSKTSNAYRNYNRLQSALHQQIKRAKKTRKRLAKEVKICSRLLSKLRKEENECDKIRKIQEKIEKATENDMLLQSAICDSQQNCKVIRKWVALKVVRSVVFSFIVGLLFAVLVRTSITTYTITESTIIISCVILFDMLLYFLPAYWSTRCTKKQYEEMDISKFVEEMHPDKFPVFPMDDIAEKGVTPIFSDKKIKQAVSHAIFVTIFLLLMMPIIGTQSAKLQKEFPIYYEDTKTYAIVYTTGTTVFMKESIVEDGTIVIDNSKQRIVTTNDLSCEYVVFERVSVVRIEDD